MQLLQKGCTGPTRFSLREIVSSVPLVVPNSVLMSFTVTTISGSTLEIVVSPELGKTLVSSAELVEQDIYASNGVLHTISSLLIPPGSLKLTPEKYLLTLNCTSFVSMIHSVNLTSLINSTTEEYTILAPKDEVLKLYSGDGDSLPEKGTDELKRLLSYHFLLGKWKPSKLKDGMLVGTALEEEGLGGARQVVDIAVSEGNEEKKERSIRFGGVSILGDSSESIRCNSTQYEMLISASSRGGQCYLLPHIATASSSCGCSSDCSSNSGLFVVFSRNILDFARGTIEDCAQFNIPYSRKRCLQAVGDAGQHTSSSSHFQVRLGECNSPPRHPWCRVYELLRERLDKELWNTRRYGSASASTRERLHLCQFERRLGRNDCGSHHVEHANADWCHSPAV